MLRSSGNPVNAICVQKGMVARELLGSLVVLECKARFEKQWDVKLGKQSETRSWRCLNTRESTTLSRGGEDFSRGVKP